MRVGMPILKLSKGGKTTKRKGNARAVATEALKERWSADPDLDRNRSAMNKYEGITSGVELADAWAKAADEHRIIDKNGKEKRLRADAVIGYSLIIKPTAEEINALQPDEQERFLDDSYEIVKEILERNGLQVDARARHADEEGLHDHVLGHDPDFKAGKKIGIRLYGQLNKEYPKRMRQKGWQVEDLTAYDAEAVKDMTDEEAVEYKARHVAKKKEKKHNQSSSAFKKAKDDERRREVDQYVAGEHDKLRRLVDMIQVEEKKAMTELDEREKQIQEREKAVVEREYRLMKEERDLQARKSAILDRAEKQAERIRQEAEKTLKTAMRASDGNLETWAKSRKLDDGTSIYDVYVMQRDNERQRAQRAIDTNRREATKRVKNRAEETGLDTTAIDRNRQSTDYGIR